MRLIQTNTKRRWKASENSYLKTNTSFEVGNTHRLDTHEIIMRTVAFKQNLYSSLYQVILYYSDCLVTIVKVDRAS